MTSAAWNGMRIPNGRLLMVGDQGYGDTIQFARYIPLIADRCQEVILGCSAEMGPLLATIPGVKQYCHRWTDVPGHAAHCRLSSVPGLVHTTLDDDPGEGAVPVRRSGAGCRMAGAAGCDAAARRAPDRAGLDRPADASQRSPPLDAAGTPGATCRAPAVPASSRCKSRCRRRTRRRWRSSLA